MRDSSRMFGDAPSKTVLALVPTHEDATAAQEECPREVWFPRYFWPVPQGGAGYVHWNSVSQDKESTKLIDFGNPLTPAATCCRI